ncbi:phosphomannomutase/phosphoglucomutase [Reinekea blandensis]|uniref:phosphomannomutase n=1 Tax=Reinekea blandensis MED297 TaxID=314283 RepID=A4BIZ3_9GAMM|nr:phosphomannomutase/phosphoglucomutase [Reinekea blandensis]EAR07926.1 CpsG protein [Reinekea sp. MED297] [Reinekea blandensis MED297]
MELTCFKAYDIRGELGTELNTDIAYRIGRAFATFLKPKKVVVGWDVRETSPELKDAFAQGVLDFGADVIDLGLCGTEEVYFGTKFLNADGGCMVTASHNPINYNGMKMVRDEAKPISRDTGLADIRKMAETETYSEKAATPGTLTQLDNRAAYVEHLMGYIEFETLKPMKIVVNAGNGAAGPSLDAIEAALKEKGAPIEFIKINHEPDGTFPNGIPNPLLHEQQPVTGKAVKEYGADLGVAWDGDFDRCFLWDEDANFIEGYYIVGLLAEAFLVKQPGAKIVYDPRLTWNTQEIVEANGGEAIQSVSGHAFIKEKMRAEDAVYGGEMSAHHYFKDFAYADSGMIPWLLVVDLLSRKQTTLKTLVEQRMAMYPSPGEINSKVADADEAMARVYDAYKGDAIAEDRVDGLSLEFADWRFNLRKSNTEPVIRLNVETRGDKDLMDEKTQDLLALIRQ